MMLLEDDYCFGLFELRQYADSKMYTDILKNERDYVVQALYDDISPTITGYDYEEGRMYSVSCNPESMAIKIIETKERYEKMIKKEERRALMFEVGMDILTDRERDVIRVHYFGHKNTLGLSTAYFSEILHAAQEKLCSFLGKAKYEHIQTYENDFKESRQRVKAF